MDNNSPRIFTNKAISVATFFGGPIAAGFLISKNFKVFGNDDAARNSIFIGILSTIILFALIFMIPENIIEKIPGSLIPPIYTGIIALLVEKLQGQKIKEFLDADGQKASNWQAAGYGLLGLSAIAVFIIILVFAVPAKSYEKNLSIDKNLTLYYSKDIEEQKSEQIAAAIKESGFLAGSEGADLYLNTKNNSYGLMFILTETTLLSDTTFIKTCNGFENYLNFILCLDKKIEIWFTDLNMQNEIELKETELGINKALDAIGQLEQYKINNFQTIFYNPSMPFEDIKKLEDAIKRLKTYFPENASIPIIFLNTAPDYTIKFLVPKTSWEDYDLTERLKNTVNYIKNNGINRKINLVLIDTFTGEERKF